MRALAGRLSEVQLRTPVAGHWDVAVVFGHLAFWDRRVEYVLDVTERDGRLFIPEIDIFVNDLSLPLWAAIPPRLAVRIGIETAEHLDRRLVSYPPGLLQEISAYNKRWVDRSLHRGEHLDEVEATGQAVRDELYAPKAGGRDFVRENLELDLKTAELAGEKLKRGHAQGRGREAGERMNPIPGKRFTLGKTVGRCAQGMVCEDGTVLLVLYDGNGGATSHNIQKLDEARAKAAEWVGGA